MSAAKTAKFLRDLCGWAGNAKAYELSEPLAGHTLVVVSPVVAMLTGPETYIFPATVESLESDDASDMSELEGSYRGGLDHAEALRRAGYEVVS